MKKNIFKLLLLAIALPINSNNGDIYDGLKNGLNFLFQKINTSRLCPSKKKQNKETTNEKKEIKESKELSAGISYNIEMPLDNNNFKRNVIRKWLKNPQA